MDLLYRFNLVSVSTGVLLLEKTFSKRSSLMQRFFDPLGFFIKVFFIRFLKFLEAVHLVHPCSLFFFLFQIYQINLSQGRIQIFEKGVLVQ